MNKRMRTILALATLLMGSQASGEESLIEHVYKACEGDLNTFCDQVTPGQGRILHCIAAHEDKISGQCGYALYQAASLLEQLATAIAYVGNECKADIQAYCSTVAAGEGRVLMCLSENADDVSDACKKAVSDVAGE